MLLESRLLDHGLWDSSSLKAHVLRQSRVRYDNHHNDRQQANQHGSDSHKHLSKLILP